MGLGVKDICRWYLNHNSFTVCPDHIHVTIDGNRNYQDQDQVNLTSTLSGVNQDDMDYYSPLYTYSVSGKRANIFCPLNCFCIKLCIAWRRPPYGMIFYWWLTVHLGFRVIIHYLIQLINKCKYVSIQSLAWTLNALQAASNVLKMCCAFIQCTYFQDVYGIDEISKYYKGFVISANHSRIKGNFSSTIVIRNKEMRFGVYCGLQVLLCSFAPCHYWFKHQISLYFAVTAFTITMFLVILVILFMIMGIHR